ncbi:uncharacterized protein with HEPN domain [Caldalkalibacillus uzonensis]|uniref:Uncharacterized protein with HEPN domain n=1 Tax=Caldalkalibacillus uzonensis TaxID=353224 RepID=A0ABU0CVZ4_9BACI|nr:hypothetical protein [Caldalkalibacillus uzonensis]MDQ0340302.1 uncharacterized protein with HEPN domain [Caldalkalibacillus uzonensis]
MKQAWDLIATLSGSMIKNILGEWKGLTPPVETANIVQELAGSTNIKEEQHGAEEECLRRQLAALLSDGQAIHMLYRSLSHYEQEVVHHFLFHIGDDFLTYRQVEEEQDVLKPNLFRLGLTGLIRKGVIYTLRRQWGEVAYYMPVDIRYSLYETYLKVNQTRAWEVCQESVTNLYSAHPSVLVDLFWLMYEWRQVKNTSLPLTKRRSIHKRILRTWQDRLPDREKNLEECPLTVSNRETYSKDIALLLDFMTREKLIRWYEQGAVLDLEQAEQWMSYSRQKMSEQFLQYWFSHYVPSSPWLQRYMVDMARLLNQQKDGQSEWVYLLSPVEVWERHYALPPAGEIVTRLEQEVILPLAGLGLVDYAETPQGEKVWRYHLHDENLCPWWIQPPMEVLVPQVVPFRDLWRLTEILALDSWQEMLVLSLDQAYVQRMASVQRSLTEWLGWFEQNSSTPVPETFKASLKLWQKQHNQVSLQEMTVLEIHEQELARAILQMPELQSFTLRAVTPHLLLAKGGSLPEIAQILHKKGIQLSTDKGHDGRETLKPLEPQLINFPRDKQQQLKVENVFPDYTDAIPAWNQLPDTWKKHFTSYHASTKRDMVQQAVTHQLKLKIEDNQGRVVTIEAVDCRTEQGEWVVYDQEGKYYKLNQLNRLQLLFPV